MRKELKNMENNNKFCVDCKFFKHTFLSKIFGTEYFDGECHHLKNTPFDLVSGKQVRPKWSPWILRNDERDCSIKGIWFVPK